MNISNLIKFPYNILLAICLIVCLTLSKQVLASEINNEFEVKGFHIDLRCQVMTMPALKSFAKELSEFGINTIIMEWEATFPFQKNSTLCNKYAYSKEEVASFIEYCTTLGIDVIPLQNCFGHVEYILSHDRYSYLREDKKEVSQVCPMKEDECVKEFTSIFKEVAALHPSKYFHIGGDETYLLGSCKLCAEKSAKEGKSKLFVDYVKAMCKIVSDLGKTPILWADIILKYPEAVEELPKNAIFVDWNYGWGKDHFGNIDRLYKLGVTFWGAPSIRSYPDNLYLIQWDKHFTNQKVFIPYSRENKYQGVVMTSWSNGGTYGFKYDTGWEVLQMYPIRYVYPLSGFRMIVACYGESLKTSGPVDAERFVINYSNERFGFSRDEGKLFWNILTTPQEVVVNGKGPDGKSVKDILNETKVQRSDLYKLVPESNKKEFEHFKLMFDMRVQYLMLKELETAYESNNFDISLVPEFLIRLKNLINESKKIDNRFLDLNKGFLYDQELVEINSLRGEKLYRIYNAVQNLTKK